MSTNWNMKRPIDPKAIGESQMKTLRKFIGARDTDDAINFALSNGINVGKRDLTQVKRSYSFLADIYNEKIEQAREKAEQARAERAKQARAERLKINKLKESIEVIPNTEDLFERGTSTALGSIANYLMQNQGKSFIGQFILGGKEIKTHELNVPKSFDEWWDSKEWEFMINSQKSYFDDYLNIGDGGTFYIYPEKSKIDETFIIQNFRDGVTNCMLTPIRAWATDLLENAKSQQTRSRYSCILRDLEQYEKQYSNGVPEPAIYEICNKLQIDISVVLPFCENVFIEAKSTKKRLKLFKFMNSRVDHVDVNELTSMDTATIVTQDELNSMRQKLDETGQFYTYNKNLNNISKISTLSGQFTTDNAFGQAVSQFESDTGLALCKIDDVDDAELSAFVREGTNYNETVDFRDGKKTCVEIGEHPFLKIPDLKHIDMRKAYANFKTCKYYNGFLGKITDFRRTNKMHGVGMYRITDLHIPDGVFKTYNDKLKIYISNNVYTSAELEMLEDMGAQFKIVSGCWGVKPLDFDFNFVMLDTKVNGSSYYAKCTGLWDSHRMDKTHWIKCTEHFFNIVRANCGADVARYFKNGEASFSYTKKHNYHLGHVTAFITAFQRLNVIEQLLNIPIENVVRVCVDGIYFTGETTLCNAFRYKEERKFGNMPSLSYVSQAKEKTIFDEFGYLKEQMDEREHYGKELHLGAGGCGKTHMNLADRGLVRVLFVAPSWKLAIAKKRETGINATVWARLITDDPTQVTAIKERANVLIVDEVSMMTDHQKQEVFDTYADLKIIMCGDLGFQLPCIKGDEMEPTGFDNIVKHTIDRRCKDPELIEIKETLRLMIEYGLSRFEINQWVFQQFEKLGRILTLEEVKHQYKIDDMILSGTNKNKDTVTALFPDMPKYYITENTRLHQNGEIIIGEKPADCKSELRHCFTTHSIQGETAEHRLYIDATSMFDSRMFYTAISRARKLKQIFLFKI